MKQTGKMATCKIEVQNTERRRIEMDLPEMGELFRIMADTAPVMIWVAGTDKLCYYFNQVWLEFTGRTMEQEIGDGWAEGVHPEDLQHCLDTYIAAFDARQKFQMEYRLKCADGDHRWILVTGTPRFLPDGRFAGYIGSCVDINDRVRASSALQESHNLLRAVIEGTADAVFVKNLQGRYVMVNSTCARIFGRSVEEIIGNDDSELMPPEIGRQIMETDRRIMTTGETQIIEEVVTLMDTGNMPVPRTYLSTKSVYRDPQGNIIGLVGIGRDITKRKRMEEVLKKANEEAQLRVEERTAELKNAIEQLQDEIAERKQTEEALRQTNQQLKQTLRELRTYQAQLVQTEKMSSLGQLVAGVAHEINNPVNFIYANLVYTSEYAQDLLHLLYLYQQRYPEPILEIQSEMEAIDLNFLMEDLPKILASMKLGAERIRQIVLSLRNFSRLDEAQMKVVDIHQGIDNTLLILQHRTNAKPDRPEIKVIKEYGNLPPVECYAGQLNQVFMNLLVNAIDALEESFVGERKFFAKDAGERRTPTITISTELVCDRPSSDKEQLTFDQVVIRIADNGCGMAESVRSHIFDFFFTTKEVGKGTGLGLSISYQIVVEKHGGELQCISAPGQGTEFAIAIPIHQRLPNEKLVSPN